jgi:hypothetical protein
VGLSYKKKFFFCLFWFLSADPENLNAGGWLKSPLALGLYAGGRTTASTETICAGTRSLVGAPPASKDPFYPPAQIVCGLVWRGTLLVSVGTKWGLRFDAKCRCPSSKSPSLVLFISPGTKESVFCTEMISLDWSFERFDSYQLGLNMSFPLVGLIQ